MTSFVYHDYVHCLHFIKEGEFSIGSLWPAFAYHDHGFVSTVYISLRRVNLVLGVCGQLLLTMTMVLFPQFTFH